MEKRKCGEIVKSNIIMDENSHIFLLISNCQQMNVGCIIFQYG